MNNSTIFQQILQLIPELELKKLVGKYNTDKYVKSFKTSHLFTTLLYAQTKNKDSLRDIESGLLAQSNFHYYLGLPDTGVKSSTLFEANNRTDYHVFEELFYILLNKYQTGVFKQEYLKKI